MENHVRFAIYYAPPPGAFADRAAAWLGWDAAGGHATAQPDLADLPAPLADLTEDPRKYGFHGTLKPPFRLADGCAAGGLDAACRALARRLAPVAMPALALSVLDGFLALTPVGDLAPLGALAARVVADLDSFRAPLTEAEIARRRPDRLSARQRALLQTWGYPYVMEAFQFHLTLTGRLAPRDPSPVQTAAQDYFGPVLPRPFQVADLCLFGEAADGRFHLLHRYPLGS